MSDEHSDRELVELAAKSTGHKPVRWVDDPHYGHGLLLEGVQEAWSPLTDDGDALRLAVARNLSVVFTTSGEYAGYGTAMVGRAPWEPGTSPLAVCKFNSAEEKPAATRRAILLAAAEIGRTQESAHG